MICLDTSSLVRYFTDDNPVKADQVRQLLHEAKSLHIPEVVLPELEYVLTGGYQATRSKLVKLFQFLISRPNIKWNITARKAVAIFAGTKLDMADCLIVAASLRGKLASFDREMLRVAGVKGYW